MCLQTVHAQIPFLNAILNFFETQSNQQPATKLLEEPLFVMLHYIVTLERGIL